MEACPDWLRAIVLLEMNTGMRRGEVVGLTRKGKVTVTFRRAARKAKIEDFRLHKLRHHFASWLTMKGENIITVMELLGHKTPAMTVRYSHLSPGYLKSAVEVLDDLSTAAEWKG